MNVDETIITEDNVAEIIGQPEREFIFTHEINGVRFFSTFINVKRKSGMIDRIPAVVNEVMTDCFYISDYVYVKGKFKSYSDKESGSLILFLFVEQMENLSKDDVRDEINKIEINGYVCKPPIFRYTPEKRMITDIMVAVNRRFGKSDYIPCIFWGENAIKAFEYNVGDNIKIRGRIQSRNYNKKKSDGLSETRTAYEVSVIDIL